MRIPVIVQKIRDALAREYFQEASEKNLPLTGHLEELRYRLIVVFITIGGCFAALFPFSEQLLAILSGPMEGQLHMLAPTEAFIVFLKLALFGALLVSLPMTFYQVWAFVAPGLYVHEKKYALPFVLLASLFFAIGGMFAYHVILPFGLHFLLAYGGGLIVPIISVAHYVSFVTRIILVFGGIFEMPLIVIFMTKFGILTPAIMRTSRKYAVIGAFVLGAVLTPPDVFTQVLMAGPLIILYELSVWICYFLSRTRDEEKGSEDEPNQ